MKGLGNPQAHIQLYIENTPPLTQYLELDHIRAMTSGEISEISQHTGNHWRKVFNVLAKLAYECSPGAHQTWQALRDDSLLQQDNEYCLRFDKPIIPQLSPQQLHIFMGKTYATKLTVSECCQWLTPYMAINEERKFIICPYFDYRQLSNIKITQLAGLIKRLS